MIREAEISLDTILAGEVLFLGLLGEMIYTYPDPHTKSLKWFEFLLAEDVFSDPPLGPNNEEIRQGMEMLRDWTAASRDRPIQKVMEDLQEDNTRLFACVGKVLAPPWESVYFNRKRLVNQDQMLEVRGWYRRYGMVVDKLFVESDDHIGLEMVFSAQLANQALKAKETGDQKKYEELIDAQRGFLSAHLLRWGTLWCDQVLKYARTDFYRGIALAVKGALAELTSAFEIETNWVSAPGRL